MEDTESSSLYAKRKESIYRWRDDNREKYREYLRIYMREYRKKNREKCADISRRSAQKKRAADKASKQTTEQ